MSEVGLFCVLKQRIVEINPITHDARANETLMRDLTARQTAAVVDDGFLLTDQISDPTFTVAARI